MRLLKVYGPQLLSLACGALFAPSVGLSQTVGNQFESGSYCTVASDYAEFCDFIIGVSYLTIDSSTATVSTVAFTDPVWGFYINVTACEDEGGEQISDCIPFQPDVWAYVDTTIQPAGTSGSATASGTAVIDLPTSGTLQAAQAGTWSETSTHAANFEPPGSDVSGTTNASEPLCPSSVSIFSATNIPLAANMNSCPGPAGSCSNFPNYLTGVGIETIMQLSPTSVNWSAMSLSEQVTTTESLCPLATACSGTGGFTPGTQPYQWTYGQQVDPLPAANTNAYFYDWHTLMYGTDILAGSGYDLCQDVCQQTYYCSGTTAIGSFTITKNGSASTIQSVPVTMVTVTKQ